MAEWERLEPYEGEDWSVVERVEEEPGSGPEENLVNRIGFGKPGIVTETGVLAAEAASDWRLLAIMLVLSARPRQAKELVGLKFYGEDRWKPRQMPHSTAYRVLKRLRELGLVEAYRGIDYRRRYYRLTGLGQKVAEKLKELLLERLRAAARVEDGKHLVTESDIEEAVGLEASLVLEALRFKRVKEYGRVYYVVPKK